MAIIDTIGGENVIVAPHGHDAVTVSVRCPRFGGISHVRLSPEQAADLAGAPTGIVLDHAAEPWRLSEET